MLIKNYVMHNGTAHISSDFLPPARFWKMTGGIVWGSVAISADVLGHISVAIKASFLKFNMCNICKNNIC